MLEQLIQTVELFIKTHASWAGPIMGAFCFIECLFIVGMFTPATAILISVGALIGLGTLSFTPIFILCLIGSLCGDTVSYYIGRKLNRQALQHSYLKSHMTNIARGRLFFRKYGGYALFIGRFIGPIRSVIPTIAGASKMRFITFTLINIITAILWLLLYLLPGILGISIGKEIITNFDIGLIESIFIVLIIVILCVFVYLFLKKIRAKQALQEQARQERKRHIAEKRRQKRLKLLDTEHTKSTTQDIDSKD
ncbi:MAG: DedA family protein [Alcaligenaceae bacterium]|nr:DedA family protein [Alcaligenaceae bacterium]